MVELFSSLLISSMVLGVLLFSALLVSSWNHALRFLEHMSTSKVKPSISPIYLNSVTIWFSPLRLLMMVTILLLIVVVFHVIP